MTTDFHPIYLDGQRINEDKSIIIGNNCWIGARCTILKGSEIPSGSVIAAGSIVCNKFNDKNCIIGGIPAYIIKNNITWER